MNKLSRIIRCALIALVVTSVATIQPSAQLANDSTKFLGNIMYNGQVSTNFDKYWNQMTPATMGKWQACELTDGNFNNVLWLDRAYLHAKQVGIPFKEHCLIWGADSAHGGAPGYIFRLTDTTQIRIRIQRWFDFLSKRYPDMDMIDVVNEPTHVVPSYINAMGGSGTTGWDWVIWCYEQARIYFPNSKLLLNDYNLLNYGAQCSKFLEIARLLKERNLVDGISCQGHTLESIPLDTIKRNLDSLTSLGIDFYVSELEINSSVDSTQQRLLSERFTLLWENPKVKGITMWGYVENQMWESQKHDAYLIKSDGITERPAFTWLKQYLNYTGDTIHYRLDKSVVGNGTITINPEKSFYNPFDTITITATPATGDTFTTWSGDMNSTVSTTKIVMISNRRLIANFTGTTPVLTQKKAAQVQLVMLRTDGQMLTVTPPAMNNNSAIGSLEISLFDMQGKLVWQTNHSQKGNTPYTVNLRQISTGSYIAQVNINSVIAQRAEIVFTK